MPERITELVIRQPDRLGAFLAGRRLSRSRLVSSISSQSGASWRRKMSFTVYGPDGRHCCANCNSSIAEPSY
jgi:hypothetical protein